MRSSRRAYSEAGADSFRTAARVAMGSSGLLDQLLVVYLDVLSVSIAIPSERILRHPGLVFRRELVADLGLHLGQGGSFGRGLLHRRDQVAEIAAEEPKMALGPDLAVPGNDRREIELLDGGQRLDPVLGVAVVQERHPVD